MPDFAEGLSIEKMRSGNAAVYILKDQFEKFSSSPHKVDV